MPNEKKMFSNVLASETLAECSVEICKGKGQGQMAICFKHISMLFLVGRDDWELFAEKLGLTPAEIRFLDKRTLNQVLEVLNIAAQKYLITVGDLYDILKDCGLPVIADFL